MTVLVDSVRYSGYHYTHDAPETWRDSAACFGMDPVIFEVRSLGKDGDQDQQKLILDINAKNLETARKVCSGCPVAAECLADANEDDRMYTVRGGIDPSKYSGKVRGRPRKSPDDPCPSGHVNQWQEGPKGRECVPCVAERRYNTQQRRIAARSLIRQGAGKQGTDDYHKRVHPDHEPRWTQKKSGRVCQECINQRVREKRRTQGVGPKQSFEELHEWKYSDHPIELSVVGAAKKKVCLECKRRQRRALAERRAT